MEILELERRWQAVLRRYFPGVIVRQNQFIFEGAGMTFLDVYMFPDERRKEWFAWYLDNGAELEQREKLLETALTPIAVSQTREGYPGIYREAQAETRTAARTAKSRVRKTSTPKASATKKGTPRSKAVARG